MTQHISVYSQHISVYSQHISVYSQHISVYSQYISVHLSILSAHLSILSAHLSIFSVHYLWTEHECCLFFDLPGKFSLFSRMRIWCHSPSVHGLSAPVHPTTTRSTVEGERGADRQTDRQTDTSLMTYWWEYERFCSWLMLLYMK